MSRDPRDAKPVRVGPRSESWLRRHGLTGLLSVFLLIALGYTVARNAGLLGSVANGAPAEVAGDSDYGLVSKHLTEVLGNGDWQFVRWWPARKMERLHEMNLEQTRKQGERLLAQAAQITDEGLKTARDILRAQAKNVEKDLERLRERGPARVCRIQYRTGSSRLHDHLFIINKDDVTPLEDEAEDLARPEFPESATAGAG